MCLSADDQDRNLLINIKHRPWIIFLIIHLRQISHWKKSILNYLFTWITPTSFLRSIKNIASDRRKTARLRRKSCSLMVDKKKKRISVGCRIFYSKIVSQEITRMIWSKIEIIILIEETLRWHVLLLHVNACWSRLLVIVRMKITIEYSVFC